MRRLLTVVIGLLAVWMGLVQLSAAGASTTTPVVAFGYDSHHQSAALTHTAVQRGPPASYDCVTVYNADGGWSGSVSARP